jgi:hypothetical protein
MATSRKAQDIARDLLDTFAKQVIATLPSQVLSADSAGNPVITLSADSTPATGEKVVVIKVKPYATGTSFDVFGNTAIAYCPTMIQFCTEANYASTIDSVADILTPAELLPVIAEIVRRETLVEWHVTANGTVPSESAIAAGTVLSKTYQPLYWGIQKAI